MNKKLPNKLKKIWEKAHLEFDRDIYSKVRKNHLIGSNSLREAS